MGTIMPPTPLSPASRPTVVVVDDDAALRTALAFSLDVEGFHVVACESGEALVALDISAGPACLVIDHRLAGMSGLDALEILRRRDVRWPAIVITTVAGAALRRRVDAASAELLEKPLLGTALISAIRRQLAPLA